MLFSAPQPGCGAVSFYPANAVSPRSGVIPIRGAFQGDDLDCAGGDAPPTCVLYKAL